MRHRHALAGTAPTPSTQTNAGAANTVLRYQLIGAAQQYPRARNLVFYLGAGAQRIRGSRNANSSRPRTRSMAVLCSATAHDGGPIPGTDIEGSSDDAAAAGRRRPVRRAVCPARPTAAPLAAALPDRRHRDRADAARRRTGGPHRNVLGARPGRSGPHSDRALPGAARLPPHQARDRGRAAVSALRWWRSGPPRLRPRRRLLVFSTPVAVLLVVAIVKLLSVVIAGDSAVSAYTERDDGALARRRWIRSPCSTSSSPPRPTSPPAASRCSTTVSRRRTPSSRKPGAHEPAESCAVRVNLELVRETLGDRAAAALDTRTAVAQYLSARTIVEQAPQGCFAGNSDLDPQRRTLRNDAVPRLKAEDRRRAGRTATTSATARGDGVAAPAGAVRRNSRRHGHALAARARRRHTIGQAAADTPRRGARRWLTPRHRARLDSGYGGQSDAERLSRRGSDGFPIRHSVVRRSARPPVV